ncbi:hypothetical protein QWZ04_02455 [Vibrio tapetis subsp. quintayensis]|uniref:hypothetical protein n=1 Tax=Vibrio tapetis TaxID=52443 RepID=UPI0025B32303|nr:hypothetical protein [Vibrio tapetis]MDN3679187.1 hypothetical protein [Vibrio tapetis subsp. quintayensis]
MGARILRMMFIGLISVSTLSIADDAQINPVAKKLKTKIERAVNKYKKPLSGYCDFTIEMEHKGKFTYVKSTRTSGDHKLCKLGKRSIKKGMRFRYKKPEKFIRIQVVQE